MAKFYDITEWNEKPFFNTKGTRNKCVVSNPEDDCVYFFKTSMLKEGKDYKPEFWSEIISSEVGRSLGFDVLEYNIAKHESEIGCISKSMNTEEECLTEGVSILTGYDNTYKPENKESYSAYTFHFIKSAIESFNLGEQIEDIIKTIIFDSIIGNSDRHQENWGFITPYKETELTNEEANHIFSKLKDRFKQIKDFLSKNEELKNPNGHVKMKILKMEGRYSPITEDLEFYAARHSFASIARNDLKVDKGTVGEALNHVDKENRMTDLYIKKDFSVINDVNSRVIDYVFNPDMMKG